MARVLIVGMNNALNGHRTFLDTFASYPKLKKYKINTLTIFKLPLNTQLHQGPHKNILEHFLVTRFLVKLIVFWRVIFKLKNYIKRQNDIKIVVCIDTLATLFIIITKKLFNYQYKIATVYLNSIQDNVKQQPKINILLNKNKFLQFVLKNSDTIITTCYGLAKEILENYNLNTVTIHNGIDVDRINYLAKSEILNSKLKKLLADKKYTKIAYTGHLSYEKGTDLLIQAFSKVVAINPNILLIIIGTGPKYKEYVNMSTKLHIKENVIFLGVAENPFPFIRSCDIYVQPNRIEGISYSTLEAMAIKKPIIATNTVDFVKLLGNNRGKLVPIDDIDKLADTIISLARKKSLLRKMGDLSYQNVLQYSIENMMTKYNTLFDKLLIGFN